MTVIGVSSATAIAAGDKHSLALKADGSVVAWGSNSYGQLGNGSTTYSTAPVTVSGLSGVTAITTRSFHSLAIRH